MKLTCLLILLFSQAAWAQSPPIAEGPFQGNLDSLKQYDCPDWFRDAKFGIWAHWGPQAVPMMGDWYAKHMYVQGHPQYEHHLATYGHPSEHGYKDIIALWKAEKWDPDRLMSLYAIALGWPEDGKLLVRSLATPAGKVKSVSLLGSDSTIEWQQTDEGLVVTVPQQKVSEYTCALKITGDNLKPAPIPQVVITVSPDAQGNFQLVPDDADLHGDQVKTEAQGGQPNIGFWDKADEWVSWNVKVDKPGTFTLSVSCATPHANAEIVAEVAGQKLTGKPAQTAGWADFRVTELGQVEFTEPGVQVVSIRPRDAASWKAINLRWVKLSAKR